MKTNFPEDFDIEAAVQAIIEDEPDLVAERENLIEALNCMIHRDRFNLAIFKSTL